MTRPEGRGRLDEIIHPVTRLSICGLLATGPQWVEFSVVRDTVGVSDSVLSKQSRILEDAGYLEVLKGAIGRRPRTWFRPPPRAAPRSPNTSPGCRTPLNSPPARQQPTTVTRKAESADRTDRLGVPEPPV
ncbi:transcriptional regulator [Streptomyces sp. GbtcB7]|uniref:transcriptional regulator n=1 Tax=Streptomyces sp. GbtcB7 TaxID=2824752 RepID=UPI0020C6B546|nr:transcriptional regulator [Streptomyces sp. GbtcB7]